MRSLNNTSSVLNSSNSLTKLSRSTNVEEVKRLNKQSGLTYNEVFALLGKNYLDSQQQKR